MLPSAIWRTRSRPWRTFYDILLLSPDGLEPDQKLKSDGLHKRIPTLTANEILIALSISAVTNPTAQLAYDKLSEIRKHVQAHSTVILTKMMIRPPESWPDITRIIRFTPSENLYYVYRMKTRLDTCTLETKFAVHLFCGRQSSFKTVVVSANQNTLAINRQNPIKGYPLPYFGADTFLGIDLFAIGPQNGCLLDRTEVERRSA